jgi:plastocyanin
VRDLKKRGAMLGLAAAAVLAFPAVSSGAATTVKATDNKTWSRPSVSVAKGGKVVWKNPTNTSHNVVAYKGAWSKSSSLGAGSKTSYKFTKRGTFKYRCTLHSELEDGKCDGMCGKVSV